MKTRALVQVSRPQNPIPCEYTRPTECRQRICKVLGHNVGLYFEVPENRLHIKNWVMKDNSRIGHCVEII